MSKVINIPSDPEGARALVNSLRNISENKTCFDCHQKTASWCSVNNGIFLCMDCCGRHRGMGVHLSFMRSAELDDWQPIQAVSMALGGNGRARQYYRQQGITDTKNVYGLPAAQQYRKRLEAEVKNAMQQGVCAAAAQSPQENVAQAFPSTEEATNSITSAEMATKVESPIARALLASPSSASGTEQPEVNVVAISSKGTGKKPLKSKKKGLGGVCQTTEAPAEVAKLSQIPQEMLFDTAKPSPPSEETEQKTDVDTFYNVHRMTYEDRNGSQMQDGGIAPNPAPTSYLGSMGNPTYSDEDHDDEEEAWDMDITRHVRDMVGYFSEKVD